MVPEFKGYAVATIARVKKEIAKNFSQFFSTRIALVDVAPCIY
jgi:hypothetical protein